MSNFLEKFKGKIQQMPKEGITQAIGAQPAKPIQKSQINNSVQQKKQNDQNSQSQKYLNNDKHSQPQLKPINVKDTYQLNPIQEMQSITEHIEMENGQSQMEVLQQEKSKNQVRSHSKPCGKKEDLEEFFVHNPYDPNNQPQSNKGSYYSKFSSKKSEDRISTSLKSKGTAGLYKYGGLGPNINTDEWKNEKNKQEKRKDYSLAINIVNQQNISTSVKQEKQEINKIKGSENSSRAKALEFARGIPKPVISKKIEQNQVVEKIEHDYFSELEEKHRLYAQQIESLKGK